MPQPSELALRYFPDAVLRERARPIDEVDDQIRALADRMIEIMHQEEGIGLAGPQVGLGLRIFVVDVPELRDEEPSGSEHRSFTNGPEVYINPRIEFVDRSVVPLSEGCLSLPEIRGEVLRPPTVRLTALDYHGKPLDTIGTGMLARCWQHEADHLDGVLIIDKMRPIDLRQNSRRIRELERQA